MKKYITGVNAAGRSCIVEEGEVVPAAAPGVEGVSFASVFGIDQSPPPAGPPQAGHRVDIRLPAGHMRCSVVAHPPHVEGDEDTVATTMHHSDAIDFVVVLEGSTTVILDEDERVLHAGDVLVFNAVDHAMKAGPEGSKVLTVAVGTPPRT
jgi:mannose-6-phosphate isomerase-like protein (cupin superfamily)